MNKKDMSEFLLKYIDVKEITAAEEEKANTQEAKTNDLPLDQYNIRDSEYTLVLKSFHLHYKRLNEENVNLRTKFFWFILLSYIGVLVISFIVIFSALYSNNSEAVIVTSIISAIVSILSSVILLPQIIAKYLFHENEQKYTIDMMTKFHKNDQMIRDNHIKEIEKNDDNREDSQNF